ncbi:hypothetical protein A2303_06645 [Candidatus Falkowbacteria bacterium RIFOXYB2_FULL_47_14]|uniref:Uncharacterized protein n=1 Tax=Candidatus Falkowbacteria bacterium RIFOXYA2_FULL_47_19 TaxID=1797994 RepID=A0A1F5SG40_9BACT|nr:MAG: hypothetical protein A2227_00390 [Candidatus Falkowbacteria bacterium RIFOXYA2_FULL_47_19]OGF35539.1 MAG: hypothetical protein A2468_05885 [Candidatus Falkowbacteria bacterium RIFOXYC2_FULL_46_15]OGF43552.1 MAG: hypothetical protein A2303_06645 [Candidatus Falkowbacteria bacterium RIFOXYB2_FULL_47_14]
MSKKRSFPKVVFDHEARHPDYNIFYGMYFDTEEEDMRIVSLLKKRLARNSELAAWIELIRVEYLSTKEKEKPCTCFSIVLAKQVSGAAGVGEFNFTIAWDRDSKTVLFTRRKYPSEENSGRIDIVNPIQLKNEGADEIVDAILYGIRASLDKIRLDIQNIIMSIPCRIKIRSFEEVNR